MNHHLPAFLLALTLPVVALGQEPAPQYQTQKSDFAFHLDALVRQEWTQDIFEATDLFRDEQRRRFRALPRVEFGSDRFKLGVGGDFNYSSDENVDPKPALLRDNYDSRDARLDLAFARIEPLEWLRIEGGRFAMPLGLTEMIWDRDLRPQGAALTVQTKDAAGRPRFTATALGARGSHVFEDQDVEMLAGSARISLFGQSESSLELVGSYLDFRKLETLEPMIRRQNTRTLGLVAGKYRILDGVVRLSSSTDPKLQLVANYCVNTGADADNKGLWLAGVIGSLVTSRARAEYTYARVDKDATVAAYATDDFFWATGWEGHRGELASKAAEKWTVHAIGQLMRFKDSPRPEEREHWVKRLRLELRASF